MMCHSAEVEIHSNFLFVKSNKVKDRERERLFLSASRLNKTVGSSLCHPKPTPFITHYIFFFLFCSFHLMSSLWEPTAPWKSFSKQRICWKGPIGGEICLWHRAGHGGRVWCINNQSSRRGEGAQPTLFSTHQRSLSEWGHCKKCPFIASSAAYCHATTHIYCAFLAFSCLRWGWFLRVEGGKREKLNRPGGTSSEFTLLLASLL